MKTSGIRLLPPNSQILFCSLGPGDRYKFADQDTPTYLGFFEGEEQVAAALLITVHARRGNFYLVPHGPILSPTADHKAVLKALLEYVKEHASQNEAVCLRIALLLDSNLQNQQLFTELGFRSAPMHIHAELTWVLDISPEENQILAGMRKTTRHAITKGANQIETSVKGLERFWPMYEMTTRRHNFVPFSRTFIEAQIKEFGQRGNLYIPIATYQGKDVAAAIIMIANHTAFYFHGASLKLPSSVPAAHVLHWESIKEAKKRGATKYNFWGIAPDNQPKHPFAGITVFKKGFGGAAINYMHAQDYSLGIGYWKFWLVEQVRRLKRGF
jgi:lipid II:glycine glycyltransferase (peptidoglycan interpeptide bridge formation enzyme)